MLRSRSKRRFGSAHAIAIAALFFALGGGAYATVQASLPANSVGTRQLQAGAVTASKIEPRLMAELKKLSPRLKRELLKIFKKFGPKRYSIGPTGPAGPVGPPGAAGPSDTYIGGAAAGSLGVSNTVIASTAVPAGEYLIQAKVRVGGNASNTAGAATCFLGSDKSGTEIWDGGGASYPALPGTLSSNNIVLVGAASFPSSQSIDLVCRSLEGSPSFDDARVWATKVGALHGLPVPVD